MLYIINSALYISAAAYLIMAINSIALPCIRGNLLQYTTTTINYSKLLRNFVQKFAFNLSTFQKINVNSLYNGILILNFRERKHYKI